MLDQVHGIPENLWSVDSTLVLYPFHGKMQHSKYVMPYEKKHTRVPQTKRYRKIASLLKLKRYTDQVIVYSTECSYINFFSQAHHADGTNSERGCQVPVGDR